VVVDEPLFDVVSWVLLQPKVYTKTWKVLQRGEGSGRTSPRDLVMELCNILSATKINYGIFLPVYGDVSITGDCLWLLDKSGDCLYMLVVNW